MDASIEEANLINYGFNRCRRVTLSDIAYEIHGLEIGF